MFVVKRRDARSVYMCCIINELFQLTVSNMMTTMMMMMMNQHTARPSLAIISRLRPCIAYYRSVFVNRYMSRFSRISAVRRVQVNSSDDISVCHLSLFALFTRCDRRGDRLRDRSPRRSLRQLHRVHTFGLNWNISLLRARSKFRFSSPVRLRFHLIDGRPRWMRSY